VTILPLLAYTAKWAATDLGGLGPARDVRDWEDYVEHVVARYSRPPFNLRYFQVWNEPTREPMTFWKATGKEWIDQVYLPAAKIIRRYDCEVVYGGWPVADAGGLFEVLDYHDAWKWTDIVDVHYFESRVFQEIYDRYIATGKCRGIWQTELGFLTFPNYYPNAYLRVLYWALTHDWGFPDKYKLFWFASWGAGPDAAKCLSGPGADGNHTLSEHGRRAEVMARLLGDDTLAALTDYKTDPPLPPTLNEDAPTSAGFTVGERRVVALIVDPGTLAAHEQITVRVGGFEQPPTRARFVSVLGMEQPLTVEMHEGRAEVQVPCAALEPFVARNYGVEIQFGIGYVVLEPQATASRANALPAGEVTSSASASATRSARRRGRG
jgi:hypothetical protein